MRVLNSGGHLRYEETPFEEHPRKRLDLVLDALAGSTSLLEVHVQPDRYLGTDVEGTVTTSAFQEAARSGFLEEMTYLASVWIQSGKSSDGCDDARTRHVGMQTHLGGALITRLISSLRDVSFFMPTLLREDGRPTQGSDVQCFLFRGQKSHLTLEEEAKFFGHQVAVYWFRRMLDSPYSHHFSRCDHCGTFFQWDRLPNMPVCKGIYCAQCKGQGSHKRNVDSRKKRTLRIIHTAAAVWNDCPKKRLEERERWVAEKVGKALDIDIKQNTITHHKDAIIQALKTLGR